MIYTQFGVHVKIIANATDNSTVLVQEIGGVWRKVTQVAALKADGGLPEVLAAIDDCGYEYPPEAARAVDIFRTTEAPRNPLTGRFIRGGEGRR